MPPTVSRHGHSASLLTASVAELPDMVKAAALHQVAQYKDFAEANDPNGTHGLSEI